MESGPGSLEEFYNSKAKENLSLPNLIKSVHIFHFIISS